MNEERVAVGIGAAAIATAAYYASLEYAMTRTQGRRAGAKDPSTPMVPIIEHADVKRMLLFQRTVCEGSLSLILQVSKYIDLYHVTSGEEKEKYRLLTELLTPVVKTYPSEMSVLSTSAAIQCLGGYGYCRDFPLEQYFRDTRIHPIHEGTTGIQGQDILGRKVRMNDGKAFEYFIEEARSAVSRAKKHSSLRHYAAELEKTLDAMKNLTAHLISMSGSLDIETCLADATLYLELFGIIAVAWQWLLQASTAEDALHKASSDDEKNFYNGKLFTCRYFFEYEGPKIFGLMERLRKCDGLTMQMKTEYFS
jgi:hypothetical protein